MECENFPAFAYSSIDIKSFYKHYLYISKADLRQKIVNQLDLQIAMTENNDTLQNIRKREREHASCSTTRMDEIVYLPSNLCKCTCYRQPIRRESNTPA